MPVRIHVFESGNRRCSGEPDAPPPNQSDRRNNHRVNTDELASSRWGPRVRLPSLSDARWRDMDDGRQWTQGNNLDRSRRSGHLQLRSHRCLRQWQGTERAVERSRNHGGVMNTSASIGALAEALAKARKDFRPVLKKSKNPFFKSNYADLSEVIDATSTALADNGLSVVQ